MKNFVFFAISFLMVLSMLSFKKAPKKDTASAPGQQPHIYTCIGPDGSYQGQKVACLPGQESCKATACAGTPVDF